MPGKDIESNVRAQAAQLSRYRYFQQCWRTTPNLMWRVMHIAAVADDERQATTSNIRVFASSSGAADAGIMTTQPRALLMLVGSV